MCFNVVSLSLLYHGLAQLDLNFPFPLAFSLSCTISLIAALLSYKLSAPAPLPPHLWKQVFIRLKRLALKKALHHMQRVHLSNRSESHATRISQILEEVRLLSDDVRKEAPFHNSTAQYTSVEKTFVFLQILSACLVAFAHGANDVANAIGPVLCGFGSFEDEYNQRPFQRPSLASFAWGSWHCDRACDLGLAGHRNDR